MSTVVASLPSSTSALDLTGIATGTITSLTSTEIVITNVFLNQVFTFGGSNIVVDFGTSTFSGKITSFTLEAGGNPAVAITDFGLSVQALAGFIVTVDGAGLLNALTKGRDSMTGSSGDDSLAGGLGRDTLVGGDGADLLIGGAAGDSLTGGAGADTFRYLAATDSATGTGRDLILDFSSAEGDKIDLSAVGPLSFSGAGFDGTAGEVIARDRFDGTWVVKVDLDGDKVDDMKIIVTTAAALTAGDFILS